MRILIITWRKWTFYWTMIRYTTMITYFQLHSKFLPKFGNEFSLKAPLCRCTTIVWKERSAWTRVAGLTFPLYRIVEKRGVYAHTWRLIRIYPNNPDLHVLRVHTYLWREWPACITHTRRAGPRITNSPHIPTETSLSSERVKQHEQLNKYILQAQTITWF